MRSPSIIIFVCMLRCSILGGVICQQKKTELSNLAQQAAALFIKTQEEDGGGSRQADEYRRENCGQDPGVPAATSEDIDGRNGKADW